LVLHAPAQLAGDGVLVLLEGGADEHRPGAPPDGGRLAIAGDLAMRVEVNHQVRDVTWREDHQHAYTGTGGQVMATIRNLALAILRLTGHHQITRTPANATPPTELESYRSLPTSRSPHPHDLQRLCNRAG
jgi:hypothetical protein